MKDKYSFAVGISAYVVAVLMVIHWALICSFDEFFHLYKGFDEQTINAMPLFLKPLYKGDPNLITLITYVLFTFSAFILIGQKRRSYFYMGISSFLMIAYLFLFLVNP